MKQKILKDYNKELNILVIFNMLLFIILGVGWEFVTNNANFIKLIVILFVSSLPSLLITNFIPEKYKSKYILYDDYNQPILSLLEQEDDGKINFKFLRWEYGCYSEDFLEQKDLWYDIYRKHEYNPRIYQVNRQYLMTRDFVVITVILLLFLSFFTLFLNTLPYVILWFIIMLMEIIAFIEMTNRFYYKLSRNVLLEETYHLRKKFSNDKYCFTYA